MEQNRIPLLMTALIAPMVILAQVSFTDGSVLLNGNTSSGGVVGVVDMDGDGLDDIAIMDNSDHFYVEYQQSNGTFVREDYGNVSTANQWGMALGDTDNDGHKDLFCGGSYDGVHHLRISSIGNSVMESPNNGSLFMQCANLADINNDGWTDAMGCHDDADSRIWINDGTGALGWDPYIDFTTTPPSDMSGNYGSCWTDFDNDGDLDLYIAKCRQGVNDPTDPRRINVLYENDGNNNYTNTAPAHGIDVAYQSWSADFADIDNDGDLDMAVTNHDHTMQLFENDGSGNFTEITSGSGLEQSGFFLQSIFRDFDNDGFVDLLIAGGVDGLYMNNGDNTFTPMPVPTAAKQLHSFGLGDLDHDGFIDIFASYGDGYVSPDPGYPDKLWLNDGNSNHWFSVDLEGVQSNRDAIGARIELYGPWGIQIREVRAGESYGIVNSFKAHFGLGAATTIDSLVIRWPSGTVDSYQNQGIDQHITVVEGGCVSPPTSITASGDLVVCTGGTPLTLTATAANSYTWNTGDTTQSITVTQGGVYSVTIDDGSGCTGNTNVVVDQDPDGTPEVTLDNNDTFCDGGQVVLTSAPADSYSWNTGDTTQSITVDQTGNYWVTVPGVCSNFSSLQQAITVVDVPADPVAPGVSLAPGPATLTATGDSVVWYDVPAGGSPVGTGSPWATPSLSTTTSYWVQAVNVAANAASFGGKENQDQLNGGYFGGTQHLIFEAYQPFNILSVKVYADGAGARIIEVIDEVTGSTVDQGTYMVPDGESRIQLDLHVPGPGEYGLRCSSNDPDMWRDNVGSNPAYPFPLGPGGSLGSILRSTANDALNYYYFFYDWEVAEPNVTCSSNRVEVVVDIITHVNGITDLDGIEIWPNPTSDRLNITYTEGALDIRLVDLTGREVMQVNANVVDLSQGVFNLDVSQLAPGEYILHATSEKGAASQRIVIR